MILLSGRGFAVIVDVRTEELPPAARIDRLHEVIDGLAVPVEARFGHGPEVPVRLRAGEVGAVQVLRWNVGAGELSRTPRHIRRADPGLCKIEVVTTGHVMIEQMGRRIRLSPGDFAFTDLSRPVHWRTTASCEMACVIFPRDLLPARHDDLAGILNVRFNGDRGTGALITALTRKLPDHLDGYRAASGARLGTVIVDLVSVALAERFGRGDEVPPGSHRRALLTRIYAFIEEHLDDPRLSPATIAAENHISVRYLYKLFQTEPVSVIGRIRERRLARCRRDLLDPGMHEKSIRAIATRWGFASAPHFNRTFRETYGIPPGEYRQHWRAVSLRAAAS